jgi:hypothetical protein
MLFGGGALAGNGWTVAINGDLLISAIEQREDDVVGREDEEVFKGNPPFPIVFSRDVRFSPLRDFRSFSADFAAESTSNALATIS